MTTFTDFARANFNGDIVAFGGGLLKSVNDLFLFDDFGDKAIWLEDGNGGRLGTGNDLRFTGPTWHIAATADFDSVSKQIAPFGNNPNNAADLLWVNDDGDLALWQSTGQNFNPFAGQFNQENLPNPGAGWHVASTNDFDGNFAADILFQHDLGYLAIWEFESFNPGIPLLGAPVIKDQLNVDQNPGATWHVVATGDIDGNLNEKAGIVFQNDNGAIAVWEHATLVGGQIHFNIQSDLPNPGPGWHVVGMGNLTEEGFQADIPGQDLVLQHDNGNIAIWQLSIQNGQVVRNNINNTDPTGFDLGNPGAGWHVVGVRDLDAGSPLDDGRADILLQNDNGATAVWTNIVQNPQGSSNGTHDGFNINPNPNPSGHLDWHVV
jgi:hypothetical protein